MDRRVLARIDDELDSSEVAELRFLCRDIISKRKLEGVSNEHNITHAVACELISLLFFQSVDTFSDLV